MSTSTVVTIHCDGCAEWVYASDSFGNSLLAWRRAIGWTMTIEDGRRQDYCPTCSEARVLAGSS